MVQGIYEEIINNKLYKELVDIDDKYIIGKEKMDSADAKVFLTQYVSNIIKHTLRNIREDKMNESEYLLKQIEVCNDIIQILKKYLSDNEVEELKINDTSEVLTYAYEKLNNEYLYKDTVTRPLTSISKTSLFTGSKFEPSMIEELKREIVTSDEIDMLVSFIKWSGLRCIMDELKDFTSKGKKLRVITTSYMGATDFKAIEELSKLPNTEIKISYDVERTRLHAKTYMFKRETGFTTAYIGSSNMSNVALTSGLEWNVKITEKDSQEVLNKMNATFETYWNDSSFITYIDNEESKEELKSALDIKKGKKNDITFEFDIKPYTYQKEILENLQAEREVFGRYKNLVVAATGVGKTVISAFDYKRFRKDNPGAKLLFIAHREEILKKSKDTFGAILKDFNFGELFVGSYKPSSIDNLFMSIQTFNSSKFYENTTPDYYDFIIVDEFHHACAETYRKLLNYYKPKILLGLTATPERMDGKNVLEYFDDRIASEMRLPEAIDNKLLSPFQYFGVSDNVDLSNLKWVRGGYDISELENVYVLNEKLAEARVDNIINSIGKYVTDIEDMKALGFCVSVKHAQFMENMFNSRGIPSISLTGDTRKEIRDNANKRLVDGEIKVIFTVDIYNEGVDIPETNTVLFLRPTESLTIFLQQLGRGLRLCEGKECLTVLDYVGNSNKNYKFADRYKALIGQANHSIEYYVKNGFINLPKGCYITLEKKAKEYVLRNIKQLKTNSSNLITKIKYFENDTKKKLTLRNFLEHYNIDIKDLYKSDRTFTRLCINAAIIEDIDFEKEDLVARRIPSLLDIDSSEWIDFILEYIKDSKRELSDYQNKMLNMLYYTFYSKKPENEGFKTIKEGINSIFENKEYTNEIAEILQILKENITISGKNTSIKFTCPLKVHSKYTKAQILAGLGYYTEEFYGPIVEGVKHFKDHKLDVFFVTLNKSEKDFSAETLYEDYAINEKLFHWQSQNKETSNSKATQRYINSRGNSQVSLFVREHTKEDGKVSPYIYLGECEYVSHSGEKPVSFVWKLEHDIPAKYISKANKNVL
ncbi:MAG: DUF3427 domain-containing protein [Clostridia bacterium]|nr:DUF3427 domain-containing protein [Clostridia bacterium]MDD4376426.1 DUF3427 domain-containing protein [Clostridia bacterium]